MQQNGTHNQARADRGRPFRIAIGGISHETNTFVAAPTTYADFTGRVLAVGSDLLRRSRIGRSTLHGVLDGADAHRLSVAPLMFAAAVPGGVVNLATYDLLTGRLLEQVQDVQSSPRPADGVILALHGAMVSEGASDGEGTLLERVRVLVGDRVPIVVVLDSHATVTDAMVAHADVILGYDSYPHIDAWERGSEAVDLMVRLLTGTKATMATQRVPMLIPLPGQRTDGDTPMREVLDAARAYETQPGVLAVTVAGGFPFSDVVDAGAAVTVVTDNDMALAERIAAEVARMIWERRETMRTRAVTVDEAIDRALSIPGGLVVLADVSDNPGAGAPGNCGLIAQRLVERGVQRAAVGAIWSAETVVAAWTAGVGGSVPGSFPGIDPAACWQVMELADGIVTHDGPMGRGGVTRMGRTAVLRQAGVDVVVCERRQQTLDPNLFRMAGIEPTKLRVVAVKSSVHYRAAFAPLAVEVIEVETGGVSTTRLESLAYQSVRRPIWPIDQEGFVLD